MVATGKAEIPVSCVEQGRWRYEEGKFSKSEAFGYSSLRRQKAGQVNCSLKTGTGFSADQSAIWEKLNVPLKTWAQNSLPGRCTKHTAAVKMNCRTW